MDTVLVTGGSGFIGRALVKLLLNKGYYVIVLDNYSNSSEENIQEFKENKNFKFIHGDITTFDYSTVDNVNTVFHLAAQINVQESLDFPDRSYQNNIYATYKLLEWIKSSRTEKKLILMGTCMVYDTSSGKPISELDRVKPASPYAGSKLAAEDLALGYVYGYDLDIRIVRPFNTYGPFQKSNLEGGVVTIFCKNLLENKPINVFGDGSQTRDLLYVDDCAELLYSVYEYENGKGEIFNGGSGRDIQIKDLAKLIAKDVVEVKFVEHHHPQSEIMKLLCDNTKAENLLKWKPKISLEQGIELTLDHLKRQE